MQNQNIHRLLFSARSVHQVDSESWTAYCPIHEASSGAHNNSLSIGAPDDGRILIKCHNGCDAKEIIYALGLTWTDCFPPRDKHTGSKITATYDYVDESGSLRFQVCRLEPGKDGHTKDFRQRQPDGTGGWTWKTKGLVKFPYRLPELRGSTGAVLIVEGEKQVDYLRSLGLTATCNPGGAGKWLKSFAKWFADRDVVVVPDCDPPNERTGKLVGASHAKEVADSLLDVAKSVHVIELPDCQPKWGMDDWLEKGDHTLEEFQAICGVATPWGPESQLVTEIAPAGAEDTMADPLDLDRKILADLGLVYCAETDAMEIEVFSSAFRKFSTIRDPGKLTYAKLLQIAGPPAARSVAENSMDEGKSYTLSHVKNAIAIVAGAGKRGSEKLGQGIWRLDEKIVLVNGGHLAVMNRILTREESAVLGEHVFDIGTNEEWFDFDQVQHWITQPDRGWMQSAFSELTEILRQWSYKIPDPRGNSSICAELLASLIVASWLQSFWIFRPMVFLLGESNSGKSALFELLIGEETNPLDDGLMGLLAIHAANQSEAGIRQAAEHASRPVFVDEFEKSKNRQAILELIRGASRGSQTIRGSAGGKSVVTKLAFMAWAASTESGLTKQVDQNRWIRINLAVPSQDRMGKLKLPDVTTATVLRNKLIAAAIVIGNQARIMAETLMAGRPKDIDHRVCQIFSVPAAVFSCINEMPPEIAQDAFRHMLTVFDSGDLERDQDTTLETILRSKVKVGSDEKTIIQMIEHGGGPFNEDLTLANYGIKVFPSIIDQADPLKRFIFLHPNTISRYALKDTELAGKKIDEILQRIPGFVRSNRRLSGKAVRGITIPFSAVIFGKDSDDDQ